MTKLPNTSPASIQKTEIVIKFEKRHAHATYIKIADSIYVCTTQYISAVFFSPVWVPFYTYVSPGVGLFEAKKTLESDFVGEGGKRSESGKWGIGSYLFSLPCSEFSYGDA